MRAILFALLGICTPLSVQAEEFAWPTKQNFIGSTAIFTNDFMGDGKDRWRTGGYALSLTFGAKPDAGLPSAYGALMEYRIRAEILTPEDLSVTTAAPDRPYAGVIGMGAFTHIELDRGADWTLGGELNFVGPSTGLGDLQRSIHDALNITQPQMLGDQLPDAIYPTVFAAVSHRIALGDRANAPVARPFLETQAGIESYIRAGVDVIFGRGYQSNFFVRDPHTGHLLTNYRRAADAGFAFTLGGDVAYVGQSKLLPTSRGYQVEEFRPRLRAGVVYESDRASFFYGATWLGEEFKAQTESQVVGTIRVRWKF